MGRIEGEAAMGWVIELGVRRSTDQSIHTAIEDISIYPIYPTVLTK